MTVNLANGDGYEHLGSTLDALRGLWRVSEARMAMACGVSRGTLQNRFKGIGPAPRADELDRYAAFFGLPEDVLRLPVDQAVVVAIQEHDFLARKPGAGGGPDGETNRTTSDEVLSNSEWTHITAGQDLAA